MSDFDGDIVKNGFEISVLGKILEFVCLSVLCGNNYNLWQHVWEWYILYIIMCNWKIST